jgi:hypothetical protein
MTDQVYASWTVEETGPERARWNERKVDCADGTGSGRSMGKAEGMPGKLSDRVRETRVEGGEEGLPDEGGIKSVEGGDCLSTGVGGEERPFETRFHFPAEFCS